jgi:hypothetical protein
MLYLNHWIKKISCLTILLTNCSLYAESVSVTVKTNEKKAFAVGYQVEGKSSGAIGKTYLGKGPKNKKYFFGYRRNLFYGENISCGSLILSKNTTVILVHKDKECHCVIE